MGVLDSYRVSRAIRILLSGRQVSTAARSQAITRLKQLHRHAVPKLVAVLGVAEFSEPVAEALASLLDNNTLALLCQGLTSSNPRVVTGVVAVLSKSRSYDPNRLLELFNDPKIPKARLLEILSTQKAALDAAALLRVLDAMDRDSRTPAFLLLEEVATESLVPDLIRRARSDDSLTRLQITRILRRFSSEAVRDALLGLLSDANKAVRQAALEGLAGMKVPVDVSPICKLLRDPDLTVQSKAIETISRINDPRAVQGLVELLQDDSEYVRRAAVEVLNQVGNTGAIKDLLGALRDKDWWVKVRAGDALGTIGGPKVVDAVLALVKDGDEFIRRCAVEILNTTKDERALDYLVGALEDQDWWVRERAVDALAGLGDKRAVPALLRMLERDSQAGPVAIRALAALGDARAVRPLLAKLLDDDGAVRAEAVRALAALADEQHAAEAQRALTELLRRSSEESRETIIASLRTLTSRFGDRVRMAGPPSPRPASHHSLLVGQAPSGVYEAPLMVAVGQVGAEPHAPVYTPPQLVNVDALEPGTVLADRYCVVRRVGSGAFGVVVLVEDAVVHEEIILKFLKPHVEADEGVIKRFIHELRYARKITHENIIRIYDFITFGKSYAISMEYFRSHPLSAELRRGELTQKQRAFKILEDICLGMSVAHQADVVHRDLKPANVLINDEDLVKIVDFGLAAAGSHGDSRLTTTGFMVGTPTYMAPEQVQGGVFDARTDIYSLGIIMYEMFTGRPPYEGPDPMSVLFQHVEGKPKPPRHHNPALSPALEACILKAMALKPAMRYQSMEQLRQHLEALSGEEGVSWLA